MRFLIVILGCLSIAPAEHPPTGIDVQLVAEVTAVRPGTPFTAALHIHHHPGYHTYWKSPGIVGLPTGLSWNLPEGFTVSPLSWPAPEFTHMFKYLAYGYESDILILTTVTPPPSLSPGTEISLSARATWMACAESCHPGTTALRLTLPVASKASADPVWGPKIARTRTSFPLPLPLSSSPSAFLAGDVVTFTFHSSYPTEGLHFISSDNLFDPNTPQFLTTDSSKNTLQVTLMPDAPPVPDQLRGFLYNAAGWPSLGGARLASLHVPLQRQSRKNTPVR